MNINPKSLTFLSHTSNRFKWRNENPQSFTGLGDETIPTSSIYEGFFFFFFWLTIDSILVLKHEINLMLNALNRWGGKPLGMSLWNRSPNLKKKNGQIGEGLVSFLKTMV